MSLSNLIRAMKKIILSLRSRAFYTTMIILFFAIIDQISKEIIIRNLNVHQSLPEEGFFRFTHVRNYGSAFNLVDDANILLLIIGILAVCLIIYLLIFVANGSLFLEISISLMLSGAIGNLTDRIRHGSVTDFIDVGTWPVFNIADSCISIGMAMLIFHLYKEWKKETNEKNKNNL